MKNFLIFDFETLSVAPNQVILNIAVACGSWEEVFQTDSSFDNIKQMYRALIKPNDNGEFIIPDKFLPLVLRQTQAIADNMRKLIRLDAYDIESQLEAGSSIQDSVVDFWSKNQQAYKQTWVDVEPKNHITDFYKNFMNYIKEKGYTQERSPSAHVVWIRAPHFDDPIAKNICEFCTGCEGVVPYNHYNVRDIRTAVDMAFGKWNSLNGYIPIKCADGSLFMDKLGLLAHDSVDDLVRDMFFTFFALNKLELV